MLTEPPMHETSRLHHDGAVRPGAPEPDETARKTTSCAMVTTIVEPTTNREITTPRLDFGSDFEARAVSPYREMGAYEVLWSDARATFKSLATRFGQHPDSVPSDFVAPEDAIRVRRVRQAAADRRLNRPGSASAYTARANTPRSCGMPPIRSSCCTTKVGGTSWRPDLSPWSEPESRRETDWPGHGAWCANSSATSRHAQHSSRAESWSCSTAASAIRA